MFDFDFNEVKKHEEPRNNSVLNIDNMFLPQLQKLLDETFKITKIIKSVSSFIDVKNKHIIIEGAYKIFPIKENITNLLKNILKDYTLIFRDCSLINNFDDINNNTCEFLTSFKNINMDKIDDNRSKIDKFPQDCNPQKFIKFINKINNPVITFSFLYNLKNLNQHISLQGKSLKIKVNNKLFKLTNKQTNKQIELIYDELIIVVDDIVSFDDLEILVRSILKNTIFTGHSIKLQVLHYFNKEELTGIEKKIKYMIDDRVSVNLKPPKTK